MNTSFEMQSPWVCYTNKIRELFKRDPDIHMTWSDQTLELHMYVDNPTKAEAIAAILPSSKQFGKNEVKIFVVPSNSENKLKKNGVPTVADAFEGNPLFSYAKTFPNIFLNGPLTYIVFTKEIIQYFNDDLSDIYCNANELAEDIAREVLENTGGVCFCTDIK